ncbi:CASC3/Barentsz eIF4AIII binding-domain-containing protein [Aspergillus coremiiformis]|uniref:CASC3/Barentsz eIF4AIII binding-domain-containing protein n=1 Tax=Aspergillus coremiiformis TaxID=138285 RepID=A0A5N6YZV0_9EURO|nr:CASC3/Barentsz eIF4AIII binding-domain-containing protein [Aspergillus coremiiformis]
MAPRRHNIGASRRKRRDEEGEDEGSINGELDDDSLSDGSGISNPDDDDADGEGSDDSDDDEVSPSRQVDAKDHRQINGRAPEANQQPAQDHPVSLEKHPLATAMSDTEAMMNGLRISDEMGEVTEVHFDDLKGELAQQTERTPSAPPTEPKKDTFAERKRREQEKFSKEKDENPLFVPMRGSFFLHDKRSTETVTNGHKPFNKSKSRPYGLIVDGNIRRTPVKPVASEGPWTHDLHDTVAGDEPPVPKPSTISALTSIIPPKPVPTAPRSSPPNRSFSSTTLIGNVPVVVSLPGMKHPIPYPSVSKKQHTRLPQHRPPLRRDKPVRISLPGQPPRYILPATERSFIFIPRALRPNQQAFRGRGRGGFYGGRRPSLYANSNYTPTIAMSRRSSFGKAPSQEGYHSPAGSVLSRHTVVTTENGKPVVRLPPPGRPPGSVGAVPQVTAGPGAAPSAVPQPLPHPQPPNPVFRESRPAPIPMHQPRPQKAVSLADIETPARFPFNPPQPQQEQPFHHQVPICANGSVYGPDASGNLPPSTHRSLTPMSHIQDRVFHAPSHMHTYQQTFWPASYPSSSVYYPGSGAEFPPYNSTVGPGTSIPTLPPGQQASYVVPVSHGSAEQPSLSGTVAHEAGGTVYFYDATQVPPNTSYVMPAAPGLGGIVDMGAPPIPFYYYPYPQGGVYYPSQ